MEGKKFCNLKLPNITKIFAESLSEVWKVFQQKKLKKEFQKNFEWKMMILKNTWLREKEIPANFNSISSMMYEKEFFGLKREIFNFQGEIIGFQNIFVTFSIYFVGNYQENNISIKFFRKVLGTKIQDREKLKSL